MKYHVELYCEQTLATVVDGPPGMTEEQAREAALQQCDDGEIDWDTTSASTTYWPLPTQRRPVRSFLANRRSVAR